MDIRVSGHQIDTGEALQNHATERLTVIVEKYFSRALSSHIVFGRAPAGAFQCDIIMHVRQNLVLKGTGRAHDAHQALDQVAEKIDKQLRRYKRRLKDHHEQAVHVQKVEEAAYTIIEDAYAEEEEAPESDAPVVIAETRIDVPQTTVSDAVMMMDLRNTTALLFKNAGTGRHNMVYRREDGAIGWVEPS